MSRLEIFVVLFIKLFQSSRSMVLDNITCSVTLPEAEISLQTILIHNQISLFPASP